MTSRRRVAKVQEITCFAALKAKLKNQVFHHLKCETLKYALLLMQQGKVTHRVTFFATGEANVKLFNVSDNYIRLCEPNTFTEPNIPPGALTPPPPKECFWVKGAMEIMKAQLQTDTF